MRCHLIIRRLLLVAWIGASACGAELPPEPARVAGFLMLHGGGELSPAVIETFARAAGGAEAKIVYISVDKEAAGRAEAFEKCGAASVKILQLGDGKNAHDDAFVAPLKDATGVWLGSGGVPGEFEKAYAGTALERELQALLKRGGGIGGSGAGAAALAYATLRGEAEKPELVKGFGFLPACVIDLRSPKRDGNGALLAALKQHPELVGFGIGPDAVLLARGRDLAALGARVQICIAASTSRAAREEFLAPNRPGDFVALQRAAMARTQRAFPPPKMDRPELAAGTLIIDGGGIPRDALLRFISAAGGPDALILAVPTAMGDTPPANPGEARMLQRAGAKNVKVFHLASRAEAFDEEKIKILREAKGIWFCGGRQWRYVDVYLDTPAEKLMHEVLAGGGAIGGSSAGATIQGEYLVRGNPLGNMQMMAEGYERGMGFLRGVAIDQHFTQRKRFPDMTTLKKVFPQVIGLGIDEGAAVVVTGHTLEVIGVGQVAIYDKLQPVE